MWHAFIAFVLGAGLGFALGRIKNRAKLAAISQELKSLESSAMAEVRTIAARIRAKL